MSTFAKWELQGIERKGWVMFDMRHKPTGISLINIYNPATDMYFNPGKGWTAKSGSGSTVTMGERMEETIRMVSLFDWIDENSFTVYFFKSILVEDSEEWDMIGFVAKQRDVAKPYSEVKAGIFSAEDGDIHSMTMETLFIKLGSEDAKREIQFKAPMYLLSANRHSFHSMDTSSLKMLWSVFMKNLEGFDNSAGRGILLDGVNRIIAETSMTSSTEYLQRILWILDVFHDQGGPTAFAVKTLDGLKYHDVMKDITKNMGRIDITKSNRIYFDELLPLPEIISGKLSKHQDGMSADTFGRAVMLCKRVNDDEAFEHFINSMVTLSPKLFSDAMYDAYTLYSQGMELIKIEKAI